MQFQLWLYVYATVAIASPDEGDPETIGKVTGCREDCQNRYTCFGGDLVWPAPGWNACDEKCLN